MGDAIINTLKGLGLWRISLLLLLLLASAGAVYGVYLWVGREESDTLEEDQQIVTVAEGNLVNQVVISGSLLFPTRETLKFGSPGVVEDIRVKEGDYVEAGQVIAALDVETLATLRQEIDDARVKIQDTEQAITDLNNSFTALDVVLAEEKIVQARVALRDAEDALEDLFTLPDLENEIVRGESDVEKAKLDLAKAEDALVKLNAGADPDDVERAVAKIDSLEVSLENAQQDLALLDDDWDAKLDAAADVRDDALAEYQDKILSYLGAEVSLEDSLLPPQDMVRSWGTSLEALFTRPQLDYSDLSEQLQLLQEDPDTPWSEQVVNGWNIFFVGSLVPVCDEDAILSPYETCISRELDPLWQEIDEARGSLDNIQKQYAATRSKSEQGIGDIEQSLTDAQTDLGDLFEPPDPLDVESARFNIYQAHLALSEAREKVADLKEQLLEKPEPIDVEAKAKAIESAQAFLAQAGEDLQSLFAPPDPLELALLQSQQVTARISLAAAQTRLASTVVVAPWSGLVASVGVEKGNEVTRNTDVIEIVDPLDVEVDGIIDEIDVLSVQVGDQATVLMDALPGEILTGVVSSIDAGATNQQGVVTYPVRVRMTVPADLNLIEGLSAVAEVVIQEERGLLIPVQAVMGRFDAPIVQVMEDGLIQQRAVTLGISDDFWVIVTSGLNEGEQVVFQAPESSGFDFGRFGGGAGFIMRGGPGR